MKAMRLLLLVGLALLLLAPAAALADVASQTTGYGMADSGNPNLHTDTGHVDRPPQPEGVPLLGDVTLRAVGYDPHLEAQVPLDIPFKDETGKSVVLGDYLKGQPLAITVNDFKCQDVCPLELQNLVDALDQVTFKLGTDYRVLAVSIDPTQTPVDATEMRNEVVRRYKRPDVPNGADGWHFLVGEQPSIAALTKAVGLNYAYDPASQTFAHPIGVILLTPEGKIARYIYGMDFPPNQLRLAIYEAAQGKISSFIAPVLLLCYHYDVTTGRYTNVAITALRGAGVLTVLGMGTFIGLMLRSTSGSGRRKICGSRGSRTARPSSGRT